METSPASQGVPESPDRSHLGPATGKDGLLLVMAADPTGLSQVRGRLRTWLQTAGWDLEDAEDVVLAANEALSNAIEHAHPPGTRAEVTLAARTLTRDLWRRAELVVTDTGRWRPPPADDENRRRGIPIMHSCVQDLTIDSGPDGTRVTLLSNPVSA
jgi:serine/threonine-protein kinase RsbW